ncbi:hypothetical protein BDN70DRAFT_899424 [Pholiota conissans]|uniref:Uncharacterized protein n=1 Tax=Pholiota conissans TaxID=109636 RepID=A0A9P5YQ87_9AGAR|nr:hypothetical protein BDN70DRAFT_899424 [Pholiota conissans]
MSLAEKLETAFDDSGRLASGDNISSPRSKMEVTTTTTTKDSSNTNTGNKDAFVAGGNAIEGSGNMVNSPGGVFITLQNVRTPSVPLLPSSSNSESELSATPGPEQLLNVVPSSNSSLPSLSTAKPQGMQKGLPSTQHPSIDSIQHKDDSIRELGDTSVAPNSKSQVIRITVENIKELVSKNVPRYIVGYMSVPDLFESRIAIPLWKPSPSLDSTHDVENWSRNIYIGDVGIFDDNGGFDTFFNIFESMGQNRRRRYSPPQDFLPYHKRLSEIPIDSEARRPSDEDSQIKLAGFIKDDKAGEGAATIMLPPGHSHYSKTHSYAALHTRDGYIRVALYANDDADVTQYCRRHQTAWYKSLKQRLNGRSLAIITASYRTRSWASAAAIAPKAGTTVKLVQQTAGSAATSYWSALKHCKVLTKNGPSPDHIARRRAYLENRITDTPSALEIEECHVIAVEAHCLQEKSPNWISGLLSLAPELRLGERR